MSRVLPGELQSLNKCVLLHFLLTWLQDPKPRMGRCKARESRPLLRMQCHTGGEKAGCVVQPFVFNYAFYNARLRGSSAAVFCVLCVTARIRGVSVRDGNASKGQAGRQVGMEVLVNPPAGSIFVRDDDVWLGRGKDNAVGLVCWHGNKLPQ